MTSSNTDRDEPALRARRWRDGVHAAVCDVRVPWTHGTVVRASRYPRYFDFNMVRVEEDPGMDAAALIAIADEALAGLAHRRVDVDQAGVGEALRPGFAAAGWECERVLWMGHEGRAPSPGAHARAHVHEVAYDAVETLRRAWHADGPTDASSEEFRAQAREVALARGVQVLAWVEGDAPVAFATLARDGRDAEITEVYVDPRLRGAGRGTAITLAAAEAAADARDLWICADDEDRPKRLYGRLGFRPVWLTTQFLRAP
ncbi:MAG TPA: GNAT family N-acetyltransferase [Solirubrobacteraceae bacterium]